MPRRAAMLLAFALAMPGCAAQTSPTCQLTDLADLPVSFTPDHIPVVTVQIAGQDVRMMVDSGAFDTIITPRAYARLNLTGTYDVQGRVEGATGEMNIGPFIRQTLTLGHVNFRDDIIMVSDFLTSARDAHFGVEGVIGEDVLQQFNVGWDLPDHKITLYAESACAPTETPWTGDYDIESFNVNSVRSPYMPFAVDGQTIPAILDSGAAETGIKLADLQKAGVSAEAQFTSAHVGIMGINGKTEAVKREEFSSVTIGAEDFSNIWLTVLNPADSNDIDSAIGEDFLAHHRVFIVNSSRTVFIGLTVPAN